MGFSGQGKNLDGWTAMHHHGRNGGAATRAGFRREEANLVHGRGVEAGRLTAAAGTPSEGINPGGLTGGG